MRIPRSAVRRRSRSCAGHAVEPDDLALRVEDHHAIGQRRCRALQLAHELHEALLVEALAPVQAHDLRDDLAPHAADVGRIGEAAVAHPPLQAKQLGEHPAEVHSERARESRPDGCRTASPAPGRPAPYRPADPPRTTMPASRVASQALAASVSRAPPTPCAPRSDSPSRARSARSDRSRIPRAPCADGGCARRWCAPRRTRCRPRSDRAAGRACRPAPGAS